MFLAAGSDNDRLVPAPFHRVPGPLIDPHNHPDDRFLFIYEQRNRSWDELIVGICQTANNPYSIDAGQERCRVLTAKQFDYLPVDVSNEAYPRLFRAATRLACKKP
jgi:hypothetical protein